ncbi:hypothetical protein SAMN06295905_1591 [Devosia lucknowensis]|uniref:Uncharacterized protein n=1 Tax=Devosia lucknowensis TaxID=1096929 RepID=A0A1Y6F132_9HYPH|nr:hypothetical protein [Devosia lucknowensis]SMQ68578.1 hypothetical protein SAMN06295905_1591 [Devosia lucknowensis]
MKVGYSLLLGEYVPADQVRYGDVAGFQIVCPCCKDPVIKVERPTQTEVTEFLSHYAAKPGTGECELRVASITAEARAQTNRESRGQTLKMFMSVLRDALQLRVRNAPEIEHASRYAGVGLVAELMAHCMVRDEWLMAQEVDRLLDIVVRSIDTDRAIAETGMAMSFRRRLAKDIVGHLRAPHAGKSRLSAARYALSNIAAGGYAVNPDRVVTTDKLVAGLRKVLTDDPDVTMGWLKDVTEDREPALRQYEILMATTGMELLSTLMRLPALAMLANHRAGRHPLHGIDDLDYFHPSSEVLGSTLEGPVRVVLPGEDDESGPTPWR